MTENIERRYITRPVELRSSGTGRAIGGYASTFGTRSKMCQAGSSRQ